MSKEDPRLPEEYLLRPRINALLSQASSHFLTTVTAGSRFGKTVAVADYARESGSVVIWVRARRMDTLSVNLWKNFLHCVRAELPGLADPLDAIPFEASFAFVDAFLSAWQTHTRDMPPLLLVLDNFQWIHNDEIVNVLRDLNDAGLANQRVIVISSRRAHGNLLGRVRLGEFGRITDGDLCFTPDEVEALLTRRDAFFTRNVVSRILEATGGWPYAVDQYVSQWQDRTAGANGDSSFDPSACYSLLQDEWYLSYPLQTQYLLMKLAQLPAFSDEIIRALAGPNDIIPLMRDLRGNQFVQYPAGGDLLYHFQPVYWRYVRGLGQYLSAPEITQVFSVAAEWFLAHGYTYEALECFQKSGEPEKGLAALQQYGATRVDTRVNDFIHNYIAGLSSAYSEKHPLMQVQLANLNIFCYEYESALQLLLPLQQTYEGAEPNDETRMILGEVYLCLSEIYFYQTRPDAADYVHKAAALLKEGSCFPRDQRLVPVNESLIELSRGDANVLQSMIAQYGRVATLDDRLYGISFKGFFPLYAAEAALAVLDIRQASDRIYEAMRLAREYDHHSIVCNAFFLSARIAMFNGDYAQLHDVFTGLDEYVQQRKLAAQYRVCDYLRGWLFLKLGHLDSVPEKIRDLHTLTEVPENNRLTCREMLIHCDYCVQSGDLARALIMIDITGHHAQRKHLWMQQIHLHILAAYCHIRLGETEKGVQALKTAYDMSAPSGILAPFVEHGEPMRTLVYAIRKVENHPFDEEWLSTVYTKANTYAKRVNGIARHFQGNPRHMSAPVKLSTREKEVLGLLYDGLTREEIGQRMGITVHGVKRHITSLYNKLGAANRSSAIRLADTMGLLKK